MDFKVKCVDVRKCPEYFTVGKVYDVKNDRVVCDNGWVGYMWAHPSNGNADFTAFSKWFADWFDFELVEDKKMFTKSDLKTGMFGVMSDGLGYFVVVGDKIIYQDDGFDCISGMTDDLCFDNWYVEKVYDGCCSFRNLRTNITGTSHNATLVYDRERDTKKPLYNGKVVCIKNGYDESTPVCTFTIGKIYNIVDGVITSDRGYESTAYERLDFLCGGMGWTFIPLVE